MSTGTGGARASLDMFDGMSEKESARFVFSCPIKVAYGMFNVLHRPLVHFEHDECLQTMIILKVFLSDMINDNQGPTQMEYELGAPYLKLGQHPIAIQARRRRTERRKRQCGTTMEQVLGEDLE